jgi:hypothetical protein
VWGEEVAGRRRERIKEKKEKKNCKQREFPRNEIKEFSSNENRSSATMKFGTRRRDIFGEKETIIE